MKKIDLHIHTIATASDSAFEFSLNKLEEYVAATRIDCIAITNHNVFDLAQFGAIASRLKIVVLPGIEIDLESGHLLLIANPQSLDDFSSKCNVVHAHIPGPSDHITVETLQSIFPDLSKYILVPHYDKKPEIRREVIKKLSEHISAGEVTSVRKFKSCLKEPNALVPVIFSDLRPTDELKTFPIRQTFVDLEEVSFNGIKSCLFDKHKVFLSDTDGNNLFLATDDGVKLSTGLNIIFGERSSGKTFTLERICQSFDNVKYIKQFSLLQNDESKFEELMSVRNRTVSEAFLSPFSQVISDVVRVDVKQNELDIKKYLTSLVKFASESDKADTFSKALLFGETPFQLDEQNGLIGLIEAAQLLINNLEYRPIIDRHFTLAALKALAVDLMLRFVQIQELNLKKSWVNDMVKKIKQELKFKTNTSPPEEVDFYRIILERKQVEKFDEIVVSLKAKKEIDRKEIRGFKVVVNARPYSGASQLKEKSGRKVSFASSFLEYDNPYKFLRCLMDLEIPETEYYQYFIDFEYKTLNRHGFPVSGGERSEFNLLHEISDALKFDLLLLDEPESSFDNLFLKKEVNELIKDIARAIPVIVVTHNSTVGASIKPDYIIYTSRELANEVVDYSVYTGYPADKLLVRNDGKTISNFEVMLNCLEAGADTYNERRLKNYEVLKN
jgi:hypothetical protein